MKIHLFALLGVVGLFSFGGCSSNSSGSADICSRAYDVMASTAERCGKKAPGDKDRYLVTCQAQLDLPGSSITAEWADTCFTAQETAECGEDVPECEEVPGELADGDSCSSDIQCKSGDCNDVDFESDGSITCGTCDDSKDSSSSKADIKEEGEVCYTRTTTSAEFKACAKGLYCDSLNSTECKALVANGKACVNSIECESGRCSKGKCADRGQEGDACDRLTASTDCASGFGCDPSTSECTKVIYADDGEDCDSLLVQCLNGGCNVTNSQIDEETGKVTVTGTCPKVLKDGAACDTSDPSETCDDYARCVAGKCRLIDSLACVDGSGSSKGSDDTSTTTTKAATKTKLKSAFGLFLSRR